MKNTGPGSLNRVYRLVRNARTGAMVPVAESARGGGHPAAAGGTGMARVLLASGLLIGAATGSAWAADPPAAGALPSGGSVVAGQAQLQQSGNRMDIQQASARAAIQWQSFNIGSAAQVHIQQPNAQSVLLNRVLGADPSAIFGKLQANGQVLLVNPNGIVFGQGSRVDVGGLVASTLDLAETDFMAGRLDFKRGSAKGSILNQGSLHAADGGYVALLAPEVINEGVVSAQLGTVALAAGDAVTLEVAGSSLLGVKVDPATMRALVENRQLVQAEGGQVILSAGAAQRLREQAVAGQAGANALVDDGGVLRLVAQTGQIQATGGAVAVDGSTVNLGGSTRAGRIAVQADHIGQGGTLDVGQTAATAGQILLAADSVVQTAQARLLADGHSGGSIRIEAGQRLYSSATLSAQGAQGQGGDIAVTADSLQLRAATLDASGASGGGRIRVGGGFQGGDSDLAHARELGVNGHTVLRADATRAGDGGQVVLWSDGSTVYGGQLSARGGVLGGNGGLAEVSGKIDLVFAGTADLAAPQGRAGSLLLDPRNILIDNAGNSLASLNLADPTPSASNGFGSTLKVLPNGNVIITAPDASTGGQAGTGAVYLFNSQTGALLSDLRGSQAGDHAGSAGVQVLANNNYLVLSPSYGTVSGVNTFSLGTNDAYTVASASAYAIQLNTSASAGAITWQSGSGSGALSIASGNSLLGSTANTDSVTRYSYSGNTINNLGSVSIAANDRLGNVTSYDAWGGVATQGTTTIHVLADGNVAVAAPNWFNGRGAVAWINGSTGALVNAAAGGEVSASTALVGSTGIRSQAPVDTDSNGKKVYVIGLDQALRYTYQDNGSNRRQAPPGAAGDSVGQSLTLLPDGGYAVVSPLWSNGGQSYAGAVTHAPSGGRAGSVATGNSVVGGSAYDFVGSGGVFTVGSSGGHYVIASPYWSDLGNAAVGLYLQNNPNGAVTWVDGGSGQVFGGGLGATVDGSNSLIGPAGAMTGARDTSTSSPETSRNDVSWPGVTSYASSTRLLASGGGGVTVLRNGNYLVVNQAWTGGRGAVSFADGGLGLAGTVSASNSLVGTTAADAVGTAVVELSGSNYLVLSPLADLGAVDGGAASWGSGSLGVQGALSTGNSLYGNHASDKLGSGGALPVGSLDGQGLRAHAIVLSPQWGNRSSSVSNVAYGAVTWIDGSNGHASGQSATGGLLSSSNSLVGSHAGDYVGSIHYGDHRSTTPKSDGSELQQILSGWNASLSSSVEVLANGDYVVRSPGWNAGRGAITWGDGNAGLSGAVSSSNSLVGSTADVISTSTVGASRAGMSFTDTTYHLTTTGDHLGLLGQALSNGNYLAISPYWNGGRGAVTWVGSGNRTGTVSSANSLVGSTPDTYADANHSAITATGDRLGTLPSTSWVVPVISEATVGGLNYTTSAFRPSAPYSFGSSGNITTLSWYSGGGSVVLGKSYSVTPPRNASLVEDWGYLSTGFQFNGYPIVKELGNGHVLLASPGWNDGSATLAGAITWINGSTGALVGGGLGGTVSAANSLVGSHSGDLLGFRLPVDGVAELSNGNFLLINPQWHEERGAVTWGSGTAGMAGTVSAANSLVGSTGSDPASLSLSTPNELYRIVGGAAVLNGDWIDRKSDLAGDRVGYGGVTALADGHAVVGSPLWSQSTAWTQTAAPSSLGAVTWINGSNGQLINGAAGGTVGAANSLVGGQAGDAVGYSPWIDPYSGQHYVASGVTALAGGRYAVASPWWSNGAVANVGAVSFASAGGLAGVVSSSNSLVGGTAGDHVGQSLSSYDPYTWAAKIDRGVMAVDSATGTNYVVRSVNWTNPYGTGDGNPGVGAGAVTWVDGSTGRAHGESGTGAVVSVANSLVGSASGDGVGGQSITLTREVNGQQQATGDLLFLSSLAYCEVPNAGAVTLLSGSHGAAGLVGWRNSLTGLASAADGLSTSGFDGAFYSTDLRATVLPTAVTAAEQVAWRPLVWVAPNNGANASRALALTVLADNAVTPTSSDQINGSGGNANWSGSQYVNDSSGLNAVGGNAGTGLLGFSANSGSDLVITPTALTALLNAGTSVTLQASNDITVLRDILVSAGGQGGNLTLEAGRSVHLRANITTDNGAFTAIANQSVANGVVDGDCSSCVSLISQAAGTSINAGSASVTLSLLDSSDKTSNAAGTLRLASVDGGNIYLTNAGLDGSGEGRGMRFNDGAVLGGSGTQRLELQLGGNSAAGGGLVLASDTQLRAADTLSVAPANTGDALRLGASSGTGLVLSSAEIGAVIQQSSGTATLQFGRTDQAGATVLSALDFSQAAMLRGAATLDADLRIAGGGGGISITGVLKSGAAADRQLELFTYDGTIALGASSVVTASTGNLRFSSFDGAVSQSSGSVLNASRVFFGGNGSATLTAGSNSIASLAGNFGSLDLKTSGSTVIGSDGLSADNQLVLQASGASADLTLDGVVSSSNGNLVLAAGRHFINNNPGDTGLVAGNGRYLVYSTNPADSTEAMSGYNRHYAQAYSAGSTPAYAGSGNWFLYSVAPTLTVSVGGGSTITYGASSSTPTVGVTGFLDGDTLANATTGSVNSSLSAYTPSSAGFIPAGSYTLTLNGQGTLASNLGYSISVVTGSSTLTVQPKPVNLSGLSASSKVYDGSTSTTVTGTASLQGGGANGSDGKVFDADSVTLAGVASGAFADRHAGTGKSVTLSGLTVGGPDGANYSISAGSVTADITPKALTLNGLSVAASKVYDGNTSASVLGTASLLTAQAVGSGSSSDGKPYSGDTVTLGGTATGSYDAATVAGASSVSFGGLSLGGAQAGNYTLSQGSQVATITPKALSVSGLTAQDKVYDGTSTAQFSGTAGLAGVVGSDSVTLTGTLAAQFADANAGSAKSISTSGLGLSGAAAGNYSLSALTAQAEIQRRSIDVTANNAAKTYGDPEPTLGFGIGGLGLVGADTAATVFSGALSTATGAAATAGSHAIQQGSLSLGNANYQLGSYTAGTLTVAKATLGVSADAKGKTYGDADPTLSYTVNAAQLKYADTAAVVSGVQLATASGAAATAGTHAINASGGTAANYELGYTAGTLTVAKATLGVTADAKSKTYGDADPTLSYTVNTAQLKYADTASVVSGVQLATATGAAATAGTHAISASGGLAANYELGYTAGTLTVAKATLGVTADAQSKTYGDADPTLSYTVNTAQLKYADTAAVVSGVQLSTATGAAATAGSHVIGASGGAAANYDLVLAGSTLTVAKATLGVSADAQSKTYGDADPTLSYSVNTAQLKYADTASVVSGVQLATATGAAATAGTHAISASGGLAANYELGYTAGTLTVAKAMLGVSADAKSKTYGDADPTLSYTVNTAQLKYADTASVVSGVQLATATGAAATAGAHAISASGGTAANYELGYTAGTLTVARASLEVTADAKSKTYGDADPTLSYTVNTAQLKYADTAAVVSGVQLATATGAAATAGSHAISASGGTSANYDLVLAGSNLSVAKAQLGVSADAKSKTYGDADPTLSYSVNAAQLKYADTAAVVSGVQLATASGAAATAGTHAINASGGTAANYELGHTAGTLTVAKATLGVTADAKSKTYGDADPTLSYTVNTAQLKYADTAAVVSGVQLATASGAAATAGTHAIFASGGTAANYELGYTAGTLAVAKATLGVTADAKSKTYGDADPTLSYTVNTAQLKYADTAAVVSGVQLSTVTGAAAAAGTHAISASGGMATNYELSLGNGTLTVAKAQLGLTADAKGKTYGDADPALSYSVNVAQLKYADTAAVVSGVQLSTVTGAAATAGTHAISASGGMAANYELSLGNGTLTVAKATLGVTADAKGKTYGDADPALSYTVNTAQLKYADTAAVVSGVQLSTVTGAAATAGTHAISASGGMAANYELGHTAGTLTVDKATLGVTADAKSKTYGDADPALSYTVNAAQLKYADTAAVVSGVQLATATGAAATAGVHAISAAGGIAANYRIVLADGSLSVAKAALTVTADDQSKTAGESDPLLTWRVDGTQLRHADTRDVISGLILSAPGGAGLPPGDYSIVPGSGVAANYELQYVQGRLVVKPSAGVKAENLSTQVGIAPATPQLPAPTTAGGGVTPGQPGTLAVLGGGMALPAGADPTPSAVPAAPAVPVTSTGATGAGAGVGGDSSRPESAARLASVMPLTRIALTPGLSLRLDTSVSFERPAQASVNYSARLADGRPLPAWLKLDPVTGVLSGQPPAGAPAVVDLVVTARADDGSAATTRVQLDPGR
ncbi:MAG: filamentous hemagglutinin N-terminal domain-containing protein [Burkholderiaceae bacterium]|nr:filamentous hemagglutinin N-terminal domain-containing protein [Burkholderiaceae bacterium]